MAQSELDALDPVPEQLKLSTGTIVEIEDLKTRQFFKLLRIVTHGALPLMGDLSLFKLDPDGDLGEFTGRLLAVLVMSIPDAVDETIDFVRVMVKPTGLIEGRKLNKADAERNEYLWAQVDNDLDNPELDDLISIVEAIVKREAADIQALGKRLMSMFNLAMKTGQLKPDRRPQTNESTPSSSADSPAPSTSSPANTAGVTTTSAGSLSVAFDSASPQSVSVSTTSGGSDSNG